MNDREEIERIVKECHGDPRIALAVLVAGFHRQEAPKTTMRFEEWEQTTTPEQKGMWPHELMQLGWDAALSHSVELAEARSERVRAIVDRNVYERDLTAARQRIEELEGALSKIKGLWRDRGMGLFLSASNAVEMATIARLATKETT